MLYTMRQAERQLGRFSRLGPTAAREAILDAVEALAASRYWDNLRQTIRFTTAGTGGRFALPQEFESIVRAAVDGTPVPTRGSEFNFLYGGPGDLDRLPSGFAPCAGLVDEGFHPPLPSAYGVDRRVVISMDAANPDLVLRVFPATGAPVDVPVLARGAVDSAADWDSLSAAVCPEEVSRMVLLGDYWPAGWVDIWAGPEDSAPGASWTSRFHSNSRVPQLRHYLIPGTVPDKSYTVLAEVRPALLRVKGDDDALPIPSLLPIQYMMQAQGKFDEGEVEAGQRFYDLAVGALMQIDESSANKQTVVTYNRMMDDSPGGDSMMYVNI